MRRRRLKQIVCLFKNHAPRHVPVWCPVLNGYRLSDIIECARCGKVGIPCDHVK